MTPPTLRYEVCVQSVAGVQAAVDAGADRVELCAHLDVGGLTPSIGAVEAAVEAAGGRVAVHVLVRPRAGDFVYDRSEIDVMGRDIAAARAVGAAGIVIGALTADGLVDEEACRTLMAAARPASVTFHRAFDATAEPRAAIEQVLALGAERLLTSGAAETAPLGAALIAELVERAGDRLIVLPGGGIRAANAGALVARTGARELHFSARTGEGPPDASLRDRIVGVMQAAELASRP